MDQKVSLKGNFTKCIVLNKIESKTYQNLCCITKTMLRGKYMSPNAYIRKELSFRKSEQINNKYGD